MRFNIGRRNNGIGEFGNIIGAANRIQLFPHFQFFHHGKNIDGHAFLLQTLHGFVNKLVCLYIKTFWLNNLGNRIKSTFFQHDGSQNSFFQFPGLWRYFAINHRAHINRRLSSFSVFIQAGQIHVQVSSVVWVSKICALLCR